VILLRVSEIRANTLFFGRGPEIEGMARLAPTIEPTESKAGSGSTAATEVTRFGTAKRRPVHVQVRYSKDLTRFKVRSLKASTVREYSL